MNAVSVAAIAASVAKVKGDEFSEKRIPIMGVAGALVFAGQMINFTIPATGSSGHIGGGILLAGLLGGVPAFLSIAAVLIIQCLFFADGGVLALGCNIFNMGVIPCLFIYPMLFKPLISGKITPNRLTSASMVAVVVGLEIGAFGVVVQTLLSGITELPFSTFVTLMLPIHLAIGLVEGAVTAAVLCFVWNMRPEIIESARSGAALAAPIKKPLMALAALTVIIGGALSLFASGNPDGLEWAIGRTTERVLGEERELEAEGGIYDAAASVQEGTAFLPDYAFKDSDSEAGTTVSGIVGAAITFALAGASGMAISKAKKSKKTEAARADG
jgi:cobalt/nickel transport system permease protein